MIEELRSDVARILKKYTNSPMNRFTDAFVLYLIYLKYLCDKKKYKYEKVINDNTIYDLFNFVKIFKKNNIDIPINSLLRNISIYDTKELTKGLINSFDSLLPIYDNDEERIIIINNNSLIYPFLLNLVGYDQEGHTTYVINNDKQLEYFKVIDEILGIKNKYLKEEEIDFTKYKYLCIYDTKPKYRVIKDYNEYDLIYNYIYKIENIILYTTYSKISNFKEGRRILKYLKNVILDNEKAILVFNKDNKETSIINYDKEKIKTLDKLKNIINNNRKQKDILVKTTYSEIISNNSRIGFSLYELDKNEEIKDINKIVDENTRLLNDLNRINETVLEEINILLNK